jgi:hypothetical protein
VLEYAVKSGQTTNNVSARLWHGGAWSASAALTASSLAVGWQCDTAVGNGDALVACNSSTNLDANLYAGGAWTDLPIGAGAPAGTPVFLASDGSDYRVEFAPNVGNNLASAVLHAGAWSSTITENSSLNIGFVSGVAGNAGTWTLLAGGSPGTGDLFVVRATGATAYTTASQMTLATKYQYVGQGLVRWPGATDAWWIDLTSSALPSVPLLYSALSL